MKKLIIIINFLLTVSITQAQFLGGIFGGLDISTVKFDNPSLQSYFKTVRQPKFGYRTGITTDMFFAEALSLKIDIQYAQKGFKYDQTYNYGWKKFNFVQISFKGKLVFNPFDKITYAAFLAPYVGYWISGEKLSADKKTNIIIHDKIYLKNDSTFAYNRIDAGITPGLQITKKINRKNFIYLELFYDFGMVSNAKENTDGMKNRSFFIGLGYYYRIKK